MCGADTLIIFGTHGNEAFLQESLQGVNQRNKSLFDAIIGNPEATLKEQRYTESDMNRIYPDPGGSTYEARRKAEVIQQAKDYKTVIDVHGTDAACGIVTLITNATISNIADALLFPADKHIIRQSDLNRKQGPVTKFVPNGFEVEVGSQQDPTSIKSLGNRFNQYLSGKSKMNHEGITFPMGVENLYVVVGKVQGEETSWSEGKKVLYNGEEYYTLLTNRYPRKGIMTACYLMKKIALNQLICDIPSRIDPSTIIM